ncbi:hypothetical protein HanOQP8_Chr05g0188091 [Helianthus annuus]|nr:hypothetical protein HanOQP8_Chr05g0188091 [Helianthus annuus]
MMTTMMLKMKVEVADGGTGRRSHAGGDVIGGDYVQVVPVIGWWRFWGWPDSVNDGGVGGGGCVSGGVVGVGGSGCVWIDSGGGFLTAIMWVWGSLLLLVCGMLGVDWGL